MTTDGSELDVTDPSVEPDRRPFPPSENRFLFVDVAALRAKQLRRGALPRLPGAQASSEHEVPHKLERIAMDEVAQGIIPFELPPLKGESVKGGT